MSTQYYTKAGDTLDWICWKHYQQRSPLLTAALNLDPQLAELVGSESSVAVDHLERGDQSELLARIVTLVLDENAGLANNDVLFPIGLNINLPDLPEELTGASLLHLWD